MNRTRIALSIIASTVVLAGCATPASRPKAGQNPPPSEAFSKFDAFELKPINTSESCNKQHGADVALRSIQENLDASLGSVVASWNRNSTGAKKASPRTLVIEPVCADVRLVGIQGRIWGGAFAGNSVIAMKVRYIDGTTRKTIAEPSFYQHASAVGAAWSFGASDRSMLTRIVDLITNYTTSNHRAAVGGPTGS